MRGAALPLWSRRADLVAWAERRLDELAALGATHVELVVLGQQEDRHSSEVVPSPKEPTAEELLQIAAAAKRRGLQVLLLPIIELQKLGDGAWRGTLVPRHRDQWWQSYERFILRWAALAATAGIEWVGIGSELGSTETWQDRWYHLISAVRKVYAGKLFYSANWDHYQVVTFWPRLDAIGISSYFQLAGTPRDTAAQMAVRWRKVQGELLRFAAAQKLPLLLTEVGVPSRDGAAMAPWDYTKDGAVDLEEQRRAFSALAMSWPGDGLAGVMIWELTSDGGEDDAGYSPRGKPSWCVLHAWWRAKGTCVAPTSR